MNISQLFRYCSVCTGSVLAVIPLAAQTQDSNLLEFYGRLNLSTHVEDNEVAGRSTDIVSNASRLGIQGETQLEQGLQLIYQIEYQINPNKDDVDKALTQRNSYIGLRGKFGTVLAGRHDTPTKTTQNSIDLYNDTVSDIRVVLDGEVRADNIILYTSPVWSGFTAKLATIVGDGDDDFSSAVSGSIEYQYEDFYAGLGVDNNVAKRDIVRLVSQYALGDFTLGALYQVSEDQTDPDADTEDGAFVSVSYHRNRYDWNVQYGVSDARADGGNLLTAGVDYSLGGRTKIFGFISFIDADRDALQSDYISVGIEHRF